MYAKSEYTLNKKRFLLHNNFNTYQIYNHRGSDLIYDTLRFVVCSMIIKVTNIYFELSEKGFNDKPNITSQLKVRYLPL